MYPPLISGPGLAVSPGVVVAGAAGGLPSLVAVPLARAGSPALVAPHAGTILQLLVKPPAHIHS